MKPVDTLKIVTRNLQRRKGRTILTAIGVTIGTAAIVAMMSLAIGLKENAVRSVNQFGNISEIEVYPGWNQDGRKSVPILNEQALKWIKMIPGVAAVMPQAGFKGQAEIAIGQKEGNSQVIGVDDKVAGEFDYKMFAGRYLSTGRREAVITYNLVEGLKSKPGSPHRKKVKLTQGSQLTMDENEKRYDLSRLSVVNKKLVVKVSKKGSDGKTMTREFEYKIAGIMDKSQYRFKGPMVFLPIKMIQEMNKWAGTDNSLDKEEDKNQQVYEMLVVKVPDKQKVERIVNYIEAMGFQANSPVTELKEINKVFFIIQFILGGIGAISLLVATIGIINTMVMSIMERTREIGIMKVLGATIPNVRNLFLIEAGTIGFIGGIAGLIISYSFAGIMNLIIRSSNFLQMPEDAIGDIAVIPIWLALFALGFATVVGVLAGIYPALRAAKLSPINAIRQE